MLKARFRLTVVLNQIKIESFSITCSTHIELNIYDNRKKTARTTTSRTVSSSTAKPPRTSPWPSAGLLLSRTATNQEKRWPTAQWPSIFSTTGEIKFFPSTSTFHLGQNFKIWFGRFSDLLDSVRERVRHWTGSASGQLLRIDIQMFATFRANLLPKFCKME